LQTPVTDVFSVVHPGEVDLIYGRVCRVDAGLQVGSGCGDSQHAPSRGDEIFSGSSGASLEDDGASYRFQVSEQYRGKGFNLGNWYPVYDWIGNSGFNSFSTWLK
jgi:hypothetical protein